MADTIYVTGIAPEGGIDVTGIAGPQQVTAVGAVAVAGPQGPPGKDGAGGAGGTAAWGNITGTLPDQADLQAALTTKLTASSNLSDVANPSQARINLGVSPGTDVEPFVVAGLSSQYWRGDKTWQDLNTAVRANRLSDMALPSTSVNMSGQKIINLAGPTSDNDAATKLYVDTVAQGLTVKSAVEVGTTAALPSNTYSSGVLTAAGNGALTIDSVSVSVNDRVLVKDEASALKNGIYKVTATGDVSNPYVLTRATDMDANGEVPGAFTLVISGTTNAGSGWIVSGLGPFTLGTTAINWVQFSSATVPDATASVKGKLQLAGDLGGTASSPQVVSTHLSAALPIAQGGTGQSTQQAAMDALAGAQSAGKFLRSDGTHTTLQLIAESDVTNLTSDLALKAPLASPVFTGTPSAPTASLGTNTTQLATTAFVAAADALDMHLAGTETVTGVKTFNAGTLLDKGTQVYDARVYGVVADGTTDNHTALSNALAAIAAAGGGILRLPAGVVKSSGMGSTTYAAGYQNIGIIGAGKDVTILRNSGNVVAITFGDGDASLGLFGRNYYIADMTIDMNGGTTGFNGGLAFGNCQDVTLERVKIIGKVSGAHAALFFGSSTNATSAMLGRNLRCYDCQFGDDSGTATASWESVTLAQAYDVKFINCKGQNQASGQAVILNYGSHNVELIGCEFNNCRGFWSNGFGKTTLNQCNFYNAQSFNNADNVTHVNCYFEQTDNSKSCGIVFVGYQQSVVESFWDGAPANTNVQSFNNKVINCGFNGCNQNGIVASTFLDGSSGKHISCYNLEVINCRVWNSQGIGFDLMAQSYLRVEGCETFNNGQGALPHYNMAVGAAVVYLKNNRSYDNQGSPTVTSDLFIDNQYDDLVPTQEIILEDNEFAIGNLQYYGPHTSPGFSTTKPSNIVMRGGNNKLMNPNTRYSAGNITGSQSSTSVWTRANGRIFAATLTGNVTFSINMPGGYIDDEWVWELTQDGTGSRTITLPGNCKPAVGGLTLSTAASAVDVITWYWDGTNWRERARAMASTTITGVVDTTTNQSIAGNKSFSGATTMTAAAASNNIPLSINQNDTTNNPTGLNISNAGTGIGINLSQTGNGQAFTLTSSGTTGGGNNTIGAWVTSTTATTGAGLSIYWNSASFVGVAGYGVANIRQVNASGSGNVLVLENAGSGKTVSGRDGSGETWSITKAGLITASFSGSGAALTSIPESAVTNLTTDLAAKAPLASPTFTGTVTVPTVTGSGAVTLTAASASNLVPLTINQNDTTNNPNALNIANTGSGHAISITHNGGTSNSGIELGFTGTTGGGNNVGGIRVTSTSATTGAAFEASWNSASFAGVSGYGVVNVRQLNASGTGNALVVEQAGSGASINVKSGRVILAASTTSQPSLNIPSGSAPTSPSSGDVWFDGTHLQARLGTTTYQLDRQASTGQAADYTTNFMLMGA